MGWKITIFPRAKVNWSLKYSPSSIPAASHKTETMQTADGIGIDLKISLGMDYDGCYQKIRRSNQSLKNHGVQVQV